MTRHYPDLGSAPDWLKQIFQEARPIRSTAQIWLGTLFFLGKPVVLALNGDCFLRLVRTRYCSLLSAVVHNCICQLKPQGWNFQLILLVPLAFLKVSLSFNLLSRKLNYKPLFKEKIKLKFKLICHDFD